ncbi:MAG: hypothetical protein WDN00_15005 [Limisphaerales bacterium]
MPLTEALLAGGLNAIEVTFRTAGAADSIARIRKALPHAIVGAGTLLTADQVKQAVDAGAQFGVSPGLSEAVSKAAHENKFLAVPRRHHAYGSHGALELGWKHLKFFPAETFGGVNALKALSGPFGHTDVKYIPTAASRRQICQTIWLSPRSLPSVVPGWPSVNWSLVSLGTKSPRSRRRR